MMNLQVAWNQKSCCASFYDQPEIRTLFGDILHPGGADLSLELANKIQVRTTDLLLDIATGAGSTPSLLSQELGCRAVGVDLSSKSLREASARNRSFRQDNLFVQSDGESLPFPDAAFDVVVSECSLCTFPSKEHVAKEIFRVLHRCGRAGISDVFLEEALPTRLRETLYKFLCIADAGSRLEYENLFKNAGFTEIETYDRSRVLLEMLDKLKKALFAAELLAGLRKIQIGLDKIQRAKSILQEVTAAAKENVIGYCILTATKKSKN
jgi:SAM-dependent methyltransferase